jgi:iron complex outermembrane recepter protein
LAREKKLHIESGKLGTAVLLLAGLAIPRVNAADENKAAILELPLVEVIGTTPLPGIGTPLSQVPGNVQVLTGKDLERQKTRDLTDYLEQNPSSININSAQANPFQPDVNFRGFTASPLLGTPQGLSVFQDGVRVNEAFGDVVNWDLIPQSAISSIQLVPGSNPVFGLNTLGGALAIHTKSGFQYPGLGVQVSGGSFGRKSAEFEWGGHGERVDYFLTANAFHEDGWREHSPSRIKQLFGKVGYQTEKSDFDASITLSDNKLEGTQALPLSMLGNPAQAYTYPDRTHNQLQFINVKGSHFFTDVVLLAGNAYVRKLKTDNFNSNLNNDFDATPAQPNPATNDLSATDQSVYGISTQITLLSDLAGRKNQFTAGLSGDFGFTDFTQQTQFADFSADRGTVATEPLRLQTHVKSDNRYLGLYLTDTFSLNSQWHITVSGRYNNARVKTTDQTGNDPRLSGENTFSHFNPALGLAFNPTAASTLFVSYNEGLRAPSPVELTCADPSAPCKLPNNFLSDPPLKPVLSRTYEFGARGKWGQGGSWSAAAFRTDLRDDIQFISSGGSLNAGFFQNVGRTRRQGLEMGVTSKIKRLTLSARYSLLDATFRSPFVIHSVDNSGADASGDVLVTKGSRIPGSPRHTLKIRADYDVTDKLALGVNVLAASSQYARGDESNTDKNGQVPGYAVVNLDARYQVNSRWQIYARVNNVFDRAYQNFGTLGRNSFNGPGNTFDLASSTSEQFRSSGAPRGIWVGVQYQLDPVQGEKRVD